MKTIKNSKDITTLEVGDKVVFGNLVYKVRQNPATNGYYLYLCDEDIPNEVIFEYLNLNTGLFIESIGINACTDMDFPETKSLEAITAIVSALFKEYEKQNELPKTWDEFCEKNRAEDTYYINNGSNILCVKGSRDPNTDKNLCTSKQEAEAFLALMQLRQLRKCYVGNWEPDLGKEGYYGIVYTYDGITVETYQFNYRNLSFPTSKLAEQFLTNFKDLLEIAKPLL